MIKKFGLATATLGALLLTGCGGGDSAPSIVEQMKEKDIILIVHDMKSAACSLYADGITDGVLRDMITDSPSKSVSCGTYDRATSTWDDPSGDCVETSVAELDDGTEDISLFIDETVACVVAGNL